MSLVELSTQSAQPSSPLGFTSCTLSLSLQTWDDSGSSAGTPVGSAVDYLVNGTTQGDFSPASIPIPYSAGWALQPSRHYGLALKGLDSCGSLPASEHFLRLALSNLSSAVLWPYQGSVDVGFSVDNPLRASIPEPPRDRAPSHARQSFAEYTGRASASGSGSKGREQTE